MLRGEFSYSINIMQKIHNMFWRDVLRHYKRLCTKCFPTNVDKFMSECIHYNVNIKRGRQVVYVKEWFDADSLFLHQLTKFVKISWEAFHTQYFIVSQNISPKHIMYLLHNINIYIQWMFMHYACMCISACIRKL